MPSNYKKVCEDNIRRRGEEFDDIGQLISEQLYSDRSHFVYELLQNAEDALERRFRQNPNDRYPCAVQFRLFRNRLEFRHFGAPFDEEDVRGISDVLKGTKKEDFVQIGKFGIGFKSVYAFTASPEIHSGDEHFVIKRYIRPEATEPLHSLSIASGETVFIFPFDHKNLSAKQAFNLILNKLRELGPRVLLFLRRIDEIKWSVEPNGEKGQYLKENKKDNSCKTAHRVTVIGEKNGQDEDEHWLLFERTVMTPDNRHHVYIEVGFKLEVNQKDNIECIEKINYSPVIVYFPTEKITNLGFLIQGPYRTTPARDNIPKNDDWNKKLINETAELVAESLRHLKEMKLLSVPLLESLPIKFEDNWYYKYSREDALRNFYKEFYPIFRRVREVLMKEEILPANNNTFVSAQKAKLVRGAALMKIVDQEQLSALFQSNDEIKWLSDEITQDRTPDLRSYLMQELNVEEVDPEVFARNLSKQFLATQDDEWFIRFYVFLSGQNALWRPPRGEYDEGGILRKKPILRLQDGSHVNPFRYDGSPNASLAIGTDTETSLPIVKTTLSSDEKVQKFLQELGVPKLDIVEEVIREILPKYTDDSVTIDLDENNHDLRKIERAYKTDSQEKKKRLQEQLRATPFILAECPSLKTTVYRKPDQVYFRSDDLRIYFSSNNSFTCVNIDHPQAELFKDLGVIETVRIQRKGKNVQGYVPIADHHGWHKRGLDGFDPDIHIEGLEFAMANPTCKKSTFIWNKIAIPNSDCIRGIVETSTRQSYEGSKEKPQLSEFGKLLIDTAWLPSSDGNMHEPRDMALKDLPKSFVHNEKLADQLGMKKDVVANLLEKAGISENTFNRAKQIEDASPEVQQQIDSLLQKKQTQTELGNIPSYIDALSETFSTPDRVPHTNDTENDGTVDSGSTQNPSRRREQIQKDISNEIENDFGERFSFGLHKKWKGKNDRVKVAFREWYNGRCQICEKTFTQLNGEPYFEGLYLVSHTTADWLDREGNVLCLCAEHSAMFQFGEKKVEKDIIQQVMQLKVKTEGGDGHPAIKMKLCDEEIEIRFAEKHLIDLQEMIKKSTESHNGERTR